MNPEIARRAHDFWSLSAIVIHILEGNIGPEIVHKRPTLRTLFRSLHSSRVTHVREMYEVGIEWV